MTALNSRACLLWWGWGPANASVFHLSSAGAGWGPRPGGWSLFWEVRAAVVHHIPKNNDFLLPIPPSFIALFIDICSAGLFRSISSYEEQMSQIPKIWVREREKSQEDYWFHYLHFGKEIGKHDFCILLHFVSCPPCTNKYWGRNSKKKKKLKSNNVCLNHPKKTKNIFRTWRAEEVMSIKRKQQNKNCPFAPSPSLEPKCQPCYREQLVCSRDNYQCSNVLAKWPMCRAEDGCTLSSLTFHWTVP